MSEEKIIKHTGGAAKALFKKGDWLHKLKEFLFEIFIIVIAVSITLWFHNWNDQLHEQRLAKDFLTGIREDLKQKVAVLDTDRVHFQHTLDYYNTIWPQMQANKVDKHYMDSLSGNLTNMLGFAFDNSRYESFKPAGNLRLIENRALLQDLTRMYTVILPDRMESDRLIFDARREQFIAYIGSKTPIGPDGHSSQISGFIQDPAIRFQIMWQGAMLNEMKEQKFKVEGQIKSLIKEIDTEPGDTQ